MNQKINIREVAEFLAFKDLISRFPKGVLSLVSDQFDLWTVITKFLPRLKAEIMAREGKLVIRPDSGDPVDIICGYKTTVDKNYLTKESDIIPYYRDIDSDVFEIDSDSYLDTYTEYCSVDNKTYKVTVTADIGKTHDHNDNDYYCFDGIESVKYEEVTLPEAKGVVELLWDIFGGSINEQGYKVLGPHIGAIYGDSITLERQVQIYERLAAKGFAATNIVLGIGSFTYVYQTRDSAGFAAKGSWFEVEEEVMQSNSGLGGLKNEIPRKVKVRKSYNIYKDPVTDDGTKKSLKGLLNVMYHPKKSNGWAIICNQECTLDEERKGLLQVIYQDGKFYNQTTLNKIRNLVLTNI